MSSRSLTPTATSCSGIFLPSFDEFYLRLAHEVSRMGNCSRKKVGAVLTDRNNKLLSIGWNQRCTEGTPGVCQGVRGDAGRGLEECEAAHAEIRAIFDCPDISKIHTVYITDSACPLCVSNLLSTPCQRMVYLRPYVNDFGAKDKWVRAGRELVHLDIQGLDKIQPDP